MHAVALNTKPFSRPYIKKAAGSENENENYVHTRAELNFIYTKKKQTSIK